MGGRNQATDRHLLALGGESHDFILSYINNKNTTACSAFNLIFSPGQTFDEFIITAISAFRTADFLQPPFSQGISFHP